MIPRHRALVALALAALLSSCSRPSFSKAAVRTARVELGRRLFYDKRLSRNQKQACSSCHLQALAFTDGKPRAVGSTGEVHPRGAPTLANVSQAKTLTWANPILRRLEQQALVPMFGERPVEMGLTGVEHKVLSRLRREPLYPPLFQRAFPRDKQPIGFHQVTVALAAFEKTLVSRHAPYDHFKAGKQNALSAAAQRGERLFVSDRLGCHRCHHGPNLTDGEFHNTALYDLDGQGAFPKDNQGLFEFSGEKSDMGKFRTATLRNIAITAPYMHDGSIASLSAVIDHYAAGGRTNNPFKSKHLTGFSLMRREKDDLIAFLKSLTDERFLDNPAYANPWSKPGS